MVHVDTLFIVPTERMARKYRAIVARNVRVIPPTIHNLLAVPPVGTIYIHADIDVWMDIEGEGALWNLLQRRQITFASPILQVIR